VADWVIFGPEGQGQMTTTSNAKVIPLAAAKPNAKGAFDKFKQAWLDQIALDHELPAGALRLCIAVSN
jgi:hypothetical protein